MQTVSDVMSTDVQVISPDATLQEAAQKMRDGDFGVLPVGDMDNLIGIITDRDIVVRAVAEGMDVDTPIRDAMSKQIVFANQDDSLEDAARLMSDHQIRRLPVVDEDHHLVGIVSLGDFAVESSDLAPVTEALSEISTPT
ncbi:MULTISPECIES: CBS domain-containing protein [Nitrosomonas]|uniref:CBS domain-containing protein n=1 Tax=Nitrosomonas communis TaxID=44574 RepID=A0A0F7KHJ2_9PROT|nr:MULTISPECIES: CBS domain-containing protein [Nitrosomonas]AKH38976.1 inosine-5-monophosphate dehydrogenase [Nitrosomonas communis]TYP81949.1 CBS domain-containing protein [Nitrosomonas communis]UVS61133.1 CBS domain-containing protein [Nitrosomonas sp. PLL12]